MIDIDKICSKCGESLKLYPTFHGEKSSKCWHYSIINKDQDLISVHSVIIFNNNKYLFSIDQEHMIIATKIITRRILSYEDILNLKGNYLHLFDVKKPTTSSQNILNKFSNLILLS